jgi:hypothetical protein
LRQISVVVGGYPHTGIMRQAFAHEAVLVMEPGADVRNTRTASPPRGG